MRAILNLLNIDIDWQRFGKSFEYMGKGMLGIFIVIAIIIVGITLLNKATSPKKNSDGEEDDD